MSLIGTKIDKSSAKQPPFSPISTIQPAFPSQSRDLLDWECIQENNTTPFAACPDVAAFADGKKIYMLDGDDDDARIAHQLYVYDVELREFEILQLDSAIKWISWIQKIDNKVYYVCENQLHICDLANKESRYAVNLNTYNYALVYLNRIIYVFNLSEQTFQKFDIDQQKWSEKENFYWGEKQRKNPVMIAIEGVLYLFAGTYIEGYSNRVARFDFEISTWIDLETTGDTPIPVSGHSLSSLNIQGVPHLVSAYGYNGAYYNVIQILNLKTMVWRVMKTNTVRTGATSVVVDNVLYTIGGCNRRENGEFEYFNDIYMYKPKAFSLKELCLNLIRDRRAEFEDRLEHLPSDVLDLI